MKRSISGVILSIVLVAGLGACTPPVKQGNSDWQAAVNANLQLVKLNYDKQAAVADSCAAGLAKAQTDMQFALAALAQQACLSSLNTNGQPQLAIQAPAPAPSSFDRGLQIADRVLGIGLQALGLKYQRDGVIETTKANASVLTTAFTTHASTAQAGYTAATSIANGGFTALGQQQPPSWQITAGGPVMVGNGNSVSTPTTTTTTTTTDDHTIDNHSVTGK